jgi:hypothetical protein
VKKFVFLAHGEMNRTPEFRAAQLKWWSSIEDHVVDSGNPLFNGRNVTKDGNVTELTPEMGPSLGYSIMQAGSMDEAVGLLTDCPMDMWVYEAMPM